MNHWKVAWGIWYTGREHTHIICVGLFHNHSHGYYVLLWCSLEHTCCVRECSAAFLQWLYYWICRTVYCCRNAGFDAPCDTLLSRTLAVSTCAPDCRHGHQICTCAEGGAPLRNLYRGRYLAERRPLCAVDHLHLVPRLRMNEAVPLLPPSPSWFVQGQLFL
jgi:hypothetical protein